MTSIFLQGCDVTLEFYLLALILISLLIELARTLLLNKDVLHTLLNPVAKALLKTFFSFKVEGKEHLKDSGAMILAGNHTGLLDSLIVSAACNRPINFLMAHVVLNWPVAGKMVKFFKVIPVVPRHGTEALNQAVELLENEKPVCIFPEGFCTANGNLNKFHKGVAYLYNNSSAPLIPFAIKGGFEAWPIDTRFPKPFIHITIQFGQAITDKNYEAKELVEELKGRVQFMKDALDRREMIAEEKQYQEDVMQLIQMKSDNNAPIKCLSIKENKKWKELSYNELSRQSKNFANYMIQEGVKTGDGIAILSESRPEWAIAFFAGICTGATIVPLDIKLTLTELNSILSNCEPEVLCVSKKFVETAKQLQNSIKSIKQVYIIDDSADQENMKSIQNIAGPKGDLGPQRQLDETALIIYTSGTTGNPKGVMISFQNLIAQLKDIEKLFNLNPNDSFLSILPLNHMLELSCGFLAVLNAGGRINYSKSIYPNEVTKILSERKISYVVTVPLFLKMLKNYMEKEINNASTFKQVVFHTAYNLSKYIPCNSIKKLLFLNFHKKLGGNLKGFISGGAPLEMEVAEFFSRIGIEVYQGYGLTETSPTISCNAPQNNKLGSVGRPLPNVSVKIAESGEILAKGQNLMKGYYKQPELTGEVIDEEGWFHTGDIGTVDQDGYLYVTGRIKNLIVLAGGKKIHPEEVEATLSKGSLIKEVCVISGTVKSGSKEGSEEVLAIVVPTDEMMAKYNNKMYDLKVLIEKQINELSQNLASYKRPTNVVIYETELPKTSTRKVKRNQLSQWYNDQQLSKVS